MKLKDRLLAVAKASLNEGVESTKTIIADNIVPSFEDMGMANVAPGEFAQGEITDKENLVNKGDMSNDTDFNKDGECPIEKAVDAAKDMLGDLVDISAPKADATLEIIKTEGPEHGPDCDCPECCHKHHHGPFGESSLTEDNQPLFMIDPDARKYYSKWYAQLSDPYGTMPENADPAVIAEMQSLDVDLNNPSLADYVLAEINLTVDKFWHKKEVWNSLIDQLVKDARENPDIDLDDNNAAWLPAMKIKESATFGESAMGKIINKALGGKSCAQYLKEAMGDLKSIFDVEQAARKLPKEVELDFYDFMHNSNAVLRVGSGRIKSHIMTFGEQLKDFAAKENSPEFDAFLAEFNPTLIYRWWQAVMNVQNQSDWKNYTESVNLKESDYAGPKDFQPDMRINASDVLNAIKQEVGDGSEGVHVVKDLDARQDPIYRVTQIDEKKLPKSLTVETITLKYEDGAYRPQGPSKEAPLTK